MATSSVSGSKRGDRSPRSGIDSWNSAPRSASDFVLPTVLLCLGARKLGTSSFVPAWQPFAHRFDHSAVAFIDAILLIALSLIAIVGPRRDLAYTGLAVQLSLWIVGLQGPGLIAAPTSVVLWLGVAEVGALAAACFLVANMLGQRRHAASQRRVAFTAFGMCCLVFGLSHFVYVDFTSKMIPSWLPSRVGLAYLTGTAHVAAGLAIASGVLRRTAAILLACMMATFVALVHIPEVFASHGSLAQVTFLLNACALTASALAVARVARISSLPIDQAIDRAANPAGVSTPAGR